MNPRVSLVIINYGTPHLVVALLGSLGRHADAGLVLEAVIVDNGYRERGDCRGAVDPGRYPFPVRFVANQQTSYASGVNRGAAVARGELIAVANTDLEWPADSTIRFLLDALDADPSVGAVGPQLVFPDGSWQRSVGRFPSLWEGWRAAFSLDLIHGAYATWRHRRGPSVRYRQVDYLYGAFLIVRRECFDALNGFDERFTFYGEDTDFCLRAARAGWKRLFVPSTRIIHVRGASSTAVESRAFSQKSLAAKRTFVRHHAGAWQAKCYALLQFVSAWELAASYRVVAAVRRTQRWRQRAAEARDGLAAVAALGLKVEPLGPAA